MSNIIKSKEESGLALTLSNAGVNIKKSEENKITSMSRRMLMIEASENSLDKEIVALKRKIANNSDIQALKKLKTERKNLSRVHSQLSDNVNGALEVMLCDYEPDLSLHQKLKKLQGQSEGD